MVESPTVSMANHNLPNYLRARRKSAGLSQEEIAFLLGFHSSHICRYERFRRTPGFRIAIAFEVIFKAPVRVLFYGDYRTIEKAIHRRVKRLMNRLRKQTANRLTEQKLAHLEKIVAELQDR